MYEFFQVQLRGRPGLDYTILEYFQIKCGIVTKVRVIIWGGCFSG